MNILIVCAEPPYPANHGGRLDVMQKIIALYELGYVLDILFVGNNIDDIASEQHLKKYSNKIYKVDRQKGLFSFVLSIFKLYPYQITSRRKLKKILINKQYDMLLLESEYVSQVLKNPTILSSRKILRIHNDEYKYFQALMHSAKGLSKAYYFIESNLFLLRRKTIYNLFTDLWFISKDECLTEYSNGKWLPPNMPIIYPFNKKKFLNGYQRLLFVGNLFTPNNLEAITWFLDKIYSKLIITYPLIKLTIAGSCKSNLDHRLISTIDKFNAKNIELILNPTDQELIEIYDQNIIFVNSMLHGAGVKLKTIDAMRNGVTVISTSIGVEGTGLLPDIHYKLANTETDFIQQIIFCIENLKEAQRIAFASYNFVANNFDIKNKIEEYSDLQISRKK